MAFKVNYGLERAERNRAKQAKKDAKAQSRKLAPGEETPPEEPASGEAEPDAAPDDQPA